MRVVWTAKARARLREIHDYIAKDAPGRAKSVVDRLTARSMTLAQPPRPGRRVREYPQEDLHELLERPFRIIYRTGLDSVEILTIKHYRQRLSDRPLDL